MNRSSVQGMLIFKVQNHTSVIVLWSLELTKSNHPERKKNMELEMNIYQASRGWVAA